MWTSHVIYLYFCYEPTKLHLLLATVRGSLQTPICWVGHAAAVHVFNLLGAFKRSGLLHMLLTTLAIDSTADPCDTTIHPIQSCFQGLSNK